MNSPSQPKLGWNTICVNLDGVLKVLDCAFVLIQINEKFR